MCMFMYMCVCVCVCVCVYFFRFFSLIGTLGYLLITDCFIYLPLLNSFLESLVSMSKLWPSTQGFYHHVPYPSLHYMSLSQMSQDGTQNPAPNIDGNLPVISH